MPFLGNSDFREIKEYVKFLEGSNEDSKCTSIEIIQDDIYEDTKSHNISLVLNETAYMVMIDSSVTEVFITDNNHK